MIGTILTILALIVIGSILWHGVKMIFSASAWIIVLFFVLIIAAVVVIFRTERR